MLKPILKTRGAADIALGILLFLAIDVLVFRSGWYHRWVDPVSRDGVVSMMLSASTNVPANARSVLVLGDSTVTERFSATIATQAARDAGVNVRFLNGGVGSSARASTSKTVFKAAFEDCPPISCAASRKVQGYLSVHDTSAESHGFQLA